MDNNNPTNNETNTAQEVEESTIVVESVQDDMAFYGIDVPESKEEVAQVDAAAETKPKEEEQKHKKKSRAQRTIERLKREKKELTDKLEAANPQKREESKPAAKEDNKVIDPDDIDIDEYEDYASYSAAVEKAEEAQAKALEEQAEVKKEEEEAEQKTAELPESLVTRITYMRADGEEDYENFNEVVSNPDVPLTQKVLEVVTESEVSADIAYYLGTNIDRAKKIAVMDKKEIQKEIMRIEIELEKKPNKIVKTTTAPDPISPVGGNSPKAKSLDDDLSFEEHEALLNKNRSIQKGGFL